RPESERHLDVHVGHCIHVNEADRAAWAVTAGSLLPTTTVTGTAEQVKARIDDLGAQGVTEVVYQPTGPDIRRELEAMFASAARPTPAWPTGRPRAGSSFAPVGPPDRPHRDRDTGHAPRAEDQRHEGMVPRVARFDRLEVRRQEGRPVALGDPAQREHPGER